MTFCPCLKHQLSFVPLLSFFSDQLPPQANNICYSPPLLFFFCPTYLSCLSRVLYIQPTKARKS
ncbi:hypothetical protein GIB67_009599 [Kingdonia uniflora]|uniref:Uncharacterized protein n=1 Tax=Kingdonia uniflora TaxID=39325 RepID=A0A7J7M485_9MAGN|nr:hypothetical protein GIB67_009599 [Kingdonia uniflora]